MPRIEKPIPAFMQVTGHFRRQIQDGILPEGAKLPTVAEIEREWGVARATAAKAVAQLQVEGLIYTSPRGSFVAGLAAKATAPQARLARYRRTGSLDAVDERHEVTAAKLVTAPTYVAELFGLDIGAQVIRREFVTFEGGTRRALTVTWHSATDVPELLDTAPESVGTRLAALETAIGTITHGEDFMHARGSDARESNALGLPTGTGVGAMAWLWTAETDDGERILVEYGESCIPPRHTLAYPYEADTEEDAA